MDKLFSAFIFRVTAIGLGVLLIPIAYKAWRQIKKQETLSSVLRWSLVSAIFALVWILVGIASSMWFVVLLSPFDSTRQSLIAQIWQSLWIFVGFFLSISNRATAGGIFGALLGLLTAVGAGSIVGFIIGFVVGLLPNGESLGLGETIFDAFMIGVFGALFASFVAIVFISPFTTFGGAIVGLFADKFGKTSPYERLFKRFRINSDQFV